jgi:hypothetical protein
MAASVTTVEGTIENGQIKLPGNFELPERGKVYVVFPGIELTPSVRIASPRLVHPEQASDFVLTVEDASDAGL